jgi:HNH endonuclease
MRWLLHKVSISELIKQAVRKRASYLCEYCHSPERISANRFTIDHVIPKSLGGTNEIDNLAIACRRCNERRYNFIAGIDPETQSMVPIFNMVVPAAAEGISKIQRLNRWFLFLTLESKTGKTILFGQITEF